MKKLILVLFMALLSKLLVAAPVSDAIFVVMGGYTSCGSTAKGPVAYSVGLYEPFNQMRQRMAKSYPDMNSHFIVSCLDSEAPPQGTAQYVVSDQPDHGLQGPAKNLLNEIERLATGKGGASVFLVGHSYGGFLAMYLVEHLRLSVPIGGLFTIDPISTRCGPTEVIFGGADCKRAPVDFNNTQLKNSVGIWINLYQTEDSWLHSGPIKEATNVRIKYRGPHTSIDNDPRTWTEIEKAISTRLSALD